MLLTIIQSLKVELVSYSAYTTPPSFCTILCRKLLLSIQTEVRDVVESVKEISSVKAALQDVQDNITTYHPQWFKIEEILASIGEEPSLP